MPPWVFRYVGNKTFYFSSKKKDFLPQNDQILPKIGIFGQFGPGHAGLFGALFVGRLVVVARGLYLARHLFTLYSGNRRFNLLVYLTLSVYSHTFSFLTCAKSFQYHQREEHTFTLTIMERMQRPEEFLKSAHGSFTRVIKAFNQ